MSPKEITKKIIDDCYRDKIKVFSSKATFLNNYNWFNLPNIIFSKYSKKEFIEVLKDPFWIKASKNPYSYYKIKTDSDIEKSSYNVKAGIIQTLVYVTLKSGHAYSDLIVKYSDGLLLREALKECNDFRLKTLASRGLKSKDYRARKEATKVCQISSLNKMLKDSRKEVRLTAIERLGMHNIADKVIDDTSIDIKLGAALCLDRIDIVEDILEKESKKVQDILNSNKYVGWVAKDRLIKIIAKLPKKKLLYNLDVKDAGGQVKALVEAKLYET